MKRLGHGQGHAGSFGIAEFAVVQGPDFEIIAMTFRMAPEIPFPMLAVEHGLEDALRSLFHDVVLRDDEILGPVGAGKEDGFPIGLGGWRQRFHAMAAPAYTPLISDASACAFNWFAGCPDRTKIRRGKFSDERPGPGRVII